MLDLQMSADGVILSVKARAGGRRNAIVGVHGGALKVAVTQPAEKGKANAAIAEVLCMHLGLKRSHVQLLAGHTSPQKKFLIKGVEVGELSARVRAILT